VKDIADFWKDMDNQDKLPTRLLLLALSLQDVIDQL
jgi:hypothetical protein